MPDEGEEGNTAYTGKLGKKGQVSVWKYYCRVSALKGIPWKSGAIDILNNIHCIMFSSHTILSENQFLLVYKHASYMMT